MCLWQVRSGGKLVWRVALGSSHTGERQELAELSGLIAYLERQASGLDLIDPPQGWTDNKEPDSR